MSGCVGGVLCLVLLGGEPVDKPAGVKRPAVTRADMALAYQRFERSFLDHRPEGAPLVDANLAFEAVTKQFFGMNFAGAIGLLNEKAIELAEERPATPDERWLASFKATLVPAIVKEGESPVLHLQSAYPVDGTPPTEVRVLVSRGKETGSYVAKIEEKTGESPSGQVELESKGSPWSGTWKIEIGLPSGLVLDTGRRLQAVSRDLDSLREENARRLDKVDVQGPALSAALATCRARNEHLKMKPGEALSTEFLADYNVLAPEIGKEIEAIEQGRDPYAQRVGDYWRVVVRGKTKIPLRVYCPPTLSLSRPVPVVVALHGAGGDENMFMDAYGTGAIKREADRVGFIAVSPATFFFTARADMLEPMLDDLALCYPVDRKRVFVLGHSMGGGATTQLAVNKGSVIRAASCIAGFRGFPASAQIPPTLVIAAEHDAIIPADRIEEAARKAIEDKLPVTYERVASYGHTLVVEAKLGRVIDWLFAQ